MDSRLEMLQNVESFTTTLQTFAANAIAIAAIAVVVSLGATLLISLATRKF